MKEEIETRNKDVANEVKKKETKKKTKGRHLLPSLSDPDDGLTPDGPKKKGKRSRQTKSRIW